MKQILFFISLSLCSFVSKAQELQVLPVTFLHVQVRMSGPAIEVTWKVNQEKEVSHYEVEKSMDGEYFLMTGTVSAAGQDAYTYIDEEDPSHFYRIKSVDLDGNIKYSPVARYKKVRPTMILKAFPVPAINEITIEHPVSNQDSKVVVHSIDGRTVMVHSVQEGTLKTSLGLSGLQAGTYFIHYMDAGGSSASLKITKQ